MIFDFVFKPETGYLHIEVLPLQSSFPEWPADYWSLDAMKENVDLIVRACQERGYNRVLVDTRAIPGMLAEFDRYRIGVHIARKMPGRPRVAVLDLKERINKFGENVAYNRGAVILVTHDREEAESWVIEK